MTYTKDQILEDINKNIPNDIDWLSGARSYLENLIQNGGKSYELWHYTKPFLGEALNGDPLYGIGKPYSADFSTFFQEMYSF